MPKLREPPETKQDKLFLALIEKNKVLCGIYEDQELAARLGIDRKTMRNKLREPDRFTRRELRRLFNILRFTEEEKSLVV